MSKSWASLDYEASAVTCAEPSEVWGCRVLAWECWARFRNREAYSGPLTLPSEVCSGLPPSSAEALCVEEDHGSRSGGHAGLSGRLPTWGLAGKRVHPSVWMITH